MSVPQRTTIDELFERYDAFLIDAYGVLIDQTSALPGAAALLARLERANKPYTIVTNDASKLETSSAAHYAARGLPIPAQKIVTSGRLLTAYFEKNDLVGKNVLVLGPSDSLDYVREAGGRAFGAADELPTIDVLVLGDEAGFDFLPGIERALSLLIRAIDRGTVPHLVLPNPDLIYPQAEGQFGFAAGTIALMIEEAVRLRFGDDVARFDRLGKPNTPIFEAAVERVQTKNCVMIGDQLETDVRGANRAGIDVALATWGLTRAVSEDLDPAIRPTWFLDTL